MPKVIHRNLKKQYILYGTIFVVILPVLLALPLISFSAVSADTNVTYEVQIEPTLKISVSSDNVSLNLNPLNKTFDSQDLEVSVGTNNPNGYKLYVNTNNSSTDLINSDYTGETFEIETLESSTATTAFPVNYWGYRISEGNTGDSSITDLTGTNFYPFSSGALISSSSVATNNNTSTLTFGSKINYNKPSGTYSLDLNFKALPVVSTYTIQSISLNPNLCTTDPMLVTDSRDGQMYAIARLKDGSCWMLQNLKLGKTEDNIALSQEDSNVDANGFTLEGKSVDGIMKKTTVIVNGESIPYQNNSSEYYCMDAYGCYYNWYTATAGYGTTYVDEDGANVNYSICPTGWALPTSQQWTTLTSAYGGTGSAGATAMLVSSPTTTTENFNGASRPGLLVGGLCGEIGPDEIGVYGVYWSRTANSARSGYYLLIRPNSVNPANIRNKYIGGSVRCLLQES